MSKARSKYETDQDLPIINGDRIDMHGSSDRHVVMKLDGQTIVFLPSHLSSKRTIQFDTFHKVG